MDLVPDEAVDELIDALALNLGPLRDAVVERIRADVAPHRLVALEGELAPALDRLLPAVIASLRAGDGLDGEETLALRRLAETWARRGVTLSTLSAVTLAASEGAREMTSTLAVGGHGAVMVSFAKGMRVAQEATSALAVGHAGGVVARRLSRWLPAAAAVAQATTGLQDSGTAPETAASPPAAPPTLSPPARDVLRLVGEGCTNAQIAAVLHLSRQAVNYHMGRLMRSVGAANRTALVARAYQRGMLPLTD